MDYEPISLNLAYFIYKDNFINYMFYPIKIFLLSGTLYYQKIV